ncbi:MAG TPA: PTS sugar transporter subunit IIA [bacterium]|nr:PTS sugar transporter subunit IIA [bacterium]
MRISGLLSEKTISRLTRTDKQGVIEELLDLAMNSGQVHDREEALRAILAREALMSTGLEKGIAVPHAKTRAVSEITMALGVSEGGVDFHSADGKPSYIFFFLLAPENAAGPNVQVLAQIARLTHDRSFCEDLRKAESPAGMLAVINDAE